MPAALASPPLFPLKDLHDGFALLPKSHSQHLTLDYAPFEDAIGEPVQFRLIYDGVLYAATNSDSKAAHKHHIRKQFHHQLKRLWEINPHLNDGVSDLDNSGYGGRVNPKNRIQSLSDNWERAGHRFVPLVTAELSLLCSIDILFLRHGNPGTLIKSGDIDNRLKTLFDALRMPLNAGECGQAHPVEGEDPFYVLLEDDKLISRITVDADVLLQTPTSQEAESHLVITVGIQPTRATRANVIFL